jgi:hypothetical protein
MAHNCELTAAIFKLLSPLLRPLRSENAPPPPYYQYFLLLSVGETLLNTLAVVNGRGPHCAR